MKDEDKIDILQCADMFIHDSSLDFISNLHLFKAEFEGDALLPYLGEALFMEEGSQNQQYVLDHLREFTEAGLLDIAHFARTLATKGKLPFLEANMEQFFHAGLSVQEFSSIRKEALEQCA